MADDRDIHPYDLAFGQGIDDRLFPPIADEASARGTDTRDPDRFLFLGSVGRLLRAVAGTGAGPEAGPDAGPDAPGPTAPEPTAPEPTAPEPTAPEPTAPEPTASEPMRQYGRLLYHAFHFWREGRLTAAVDAPTLRRILDGEAEAGITDRELRAPAAAGYLRLPHNLVWAAAAAGMTPEPVHGCFWTLVDDTDPRALHLLLALGVRADRAGYSVAPATGLMDDVPHWAAIDARPGGTDFETTLPGGEMDRLYSVESPAEMLKLASLCFLHLEGAGRG